MSAPRLALTLALTAPLVASAAHAQPVTKDRPVSTPVARGAARTVWPDEGPATWAPRPTAPEITANDLRSRLYPLADDSMMGRRIGELGNFKGTDYIAREFRRLGLKPGGENGTYFQVMPFGPARFDSASARLAVGGQPLSQKTDWIPTAPSTANGFGGRAELTNVPTVFAGEWGATTAIDPALVRGKVAVFVAAQGSGAAAGGGGRGGAPAQQRCDSLPDRFGAAAAGAVEAAQREAAARAAAARGQRPTTAALATARDVRAQTAGAAAVLVVGLDTLPRNTVAGAFDTRNGDAADARDRRCRARSSRAPRRSGCSARRSTQLTRRHRRAAGERDAGATTGACRRRRRATSSRSCPAPTRRAPASTCSSARTTITSARTRWPSTTTRCAP